MFKHRLIQWFMRNGLFVVLGIQVLFASFAAYLLYLVIKVLLKLI